MHRFGRLLLILGSLTYIACHGAVDEELRSLLAVQGIEKLDFGATRPAARIALGRALYYDKELSGNRDISCATCHHPTAHTGDDLSLPIGTGGRGLAAERQLASANAFVPRNSTEIFNRGASAWRTMFWDSRVMQGRRGIISPAGPQLPEAVDDVLWAQALFPPTSRDEMRGSHGDIDVRGTANELAELDDDDFDGIWKALMSRLLRIPDYVALFGAAFPNVSREQLSFAHAARAIADYEASAFTFTNSAWDRYLRGERDALSIKQKRGAVLFYSTAACSRCHTGALLTDQRVHNVCAPQIGPGKGAESPDDHGRARETQNPDDLHAFRTPPLRNVTLTGPWMHDGSYTSLAAVIEHQLDPLGALQRYDRQQLDPRLRAAVMSDLTLTERMENALDPIMRRRPKLSESQKADLLAFLGALTDPAAQQMAHLVPESVPSGLPIN